MAKFIQYSTKDSQYNGPFDPKSGWPAAGLGDLLVSSDGSLVVIDGGSPNDAEGFIDLLEKYSNGKKPVVELWIITHSHSDHSGAVTAMSKDPDLLSRIEVKKFVYLFPIEFGNKEGAVGILEQKIKNMDAVATAFGAEIETPYRDQKIIVNDLEFHFLYVPDDCSILNTTDGNCNHCSLIFTVQGPKKKAIITGDASKRTLQITAWRYYHSLKCDIMQFPHHALADSYCKDFYRYVDAKTVLMPISIAGYRAMHSNMYAFGEGQMLNLVAEAKADNVYKAFEETTELEI